MYPQLPPRESGSLDVGDGQLLFWERYGTVGAKPAVVLHGGPGSGAGPAWSRYFDPAAYDVLLFDQRGCGRSTPSAGDVGTDLSVNTTDHLIADIEALRELVGAERWLVLGGSWGSTLALAYAERHPERVSEVVLFSVATTTGPEVEWVTRDMGRVFPAEWAEFVAAVPEDGRDGDLAAAYARLLADPDEAVRERAARAWCRWEDTHVSLLPGYTNDPRYEDPAFRLTFARLVTHYWSHRAWRGDDELLDGVDRIGDIPAVLVHGRYDVSSPLDVPWRLAERWPAATLQVVDGGHGIGTADAVVAALDAFRNPLAG